MVPGMPFGIVQVIYVDFEKSNSCFG